MKRAFLLLFLAACARGTPPEERPMRDGSRTARPEHAVLFIIDGLSYKALERLPLKNLRALVETGTYYEKSYNIVPAHPKGGEYSKYHTSSVPNPVLLAGTVLLRRDQKYVQHSFWPERITAHAANDIDYRALNVGFNLTFLHGSDDRPVHDDQTMAWTLEFLRKARPAFMRIHLQDTGNAGGLSYEEKDPKVPWRRNIWAEGSPYRKAAVRADEYLGEFLRALQESGLRDKTALFVTADHGEWDGGWHPPEEEDGWIMPLVLAGPGIAAGRRFECAEHVDIVPTLCHLMGVKPPENADGRILAEALVSPPEGVRPARQRIRELNTLLKEGAALIAGLPEEKRAEAQREFFGIERVMDWSRFGTTDALLEHNRKVVAGLAGK